jgi:predicted short-subunit dehydrogenase-like oxidoreductase (DUF2520 family)
MRVIIIGSGNVAHILGRACISAGHKVVQVYGRDLGRAMHVASITQSAYTDDLSKIDQSGDIYILAVTDTAVSEIAASLRLGRKMIVHTAGSIPIGVLHSVSTNYGVLYPVQSLRTEMTILPEIPFMVDGNTADNMALIYDFASSLSYNVHKASDEQRLKLHIAAVVVSNFSNHLYALSEEYCKKESISFRILMPLIEAIAQRVHEFSPAQVQTGPAVRHDRNTINKHIDLLKDHPALQELYIRFTKSIEEMYP